MAYAYLQALHPSYICPHRNLPRDPLGIQVLFRIEATLKATQPLKGRRIELFEIDDSITSTVWHSDVSYELYPPGLTTVFLLSQPQTGGDTFTSQVSALKELSPRFAAFLRTLKAVHSGVEQANFSCSGHRGTIVRRDPVENVHPVIRRYPVTGEEAIYVNKQLTRSIVGLKREESGVILFYTPGIDYLAWLFGHFYFLETIFKFLYDRPD